MRRLLISTLQYVWTRTRTYAARCVAKEASDQVETAIADCQEALRLETNPDSIFAVMAKESMNRLIAAAATLREVRALAEQGDVEAQHNLGYMYYENVPRDYAEAAKWYRKAADQGFASSQYNLGNMYYYGEGVPRDDAEAVKWFRRAADQDYAQAQHKLGSIYQEGLVVRKDYTEAAKWY